MKIDFIIVGQGLAGTLLAYELGRLNRTFLVYNDPDQKGASSVAAGVINPVVFRRMTKSWMVDRVFEQIESTYGALEELLNEKLYDRCQIRKILNEDSAQFWKEKVTANQLEQYLEAEPALKFRHPNIHSPFGVGIVTKAGRVNIQKLMGAFGAWLEKQNLLRNEKFQLDQLVVNAQSVRYKDVEAEKVVFCEGAAASYNPWFSDLKFKHSKGELLEVNIPDLHLNEIISHEVFLIPLGGDRYKVGATYGWEDLSLKTSPEAKEELLTKLKSLVTAPIEIMDQKAGIRPTMNDRKPILGLLPDHPSIGLFNGLGSKGALLGPWFARHLAEYLTGITTQLDPEVNLEMRRGENGKMRT